MAVWLQLVMLWLQYMDLIAYRMGYFYIYDTLYRLW